MAAAQYEEVLRQVNLLSPADQERLLAEVMQRLCRLPEQTTSILQLQGLEKEVWSDVNAQEYIDQERASWNG